MTMIASVTCKACKQPCELSGCTRQYPPVPNDRDEVIARIRAALKERSGKPWSVKGGRGTAWGWIQISVPPKRLGCAAHHDFDWSTHECKACGAHQFHREAGAPLGCPGHVCDATCYRAYITPDERAELMTLLGLDSGNDVHHQGISIPSGGAYYTEYVDRAEGRRPRAHGVPYWD